MLKNSSAKYYQYNKKARKRFQSFSKEKKEKSNNMVTKDTKISQKMKNKS